MIRPFDPLLFRVVSRFQAAKAMQNGTSKYAFVWDQPVPKMSNSRRYHRRMQPGMHADCEGNRANASSKIESCPGLLSN